ncbi:MAG TPA: TIGR03435 family protein [Bryobacteraceae bacterium]|nr:TIGR03435 family protein [Bryobacteraceae bacterium]
MSLFFAALLCAQDKPAFEVASVRAHGPDDGRFSFDIKESGRLTTRNMTVWNLIREAYGQRDSQMTGGPAWIKTEGFDVAAQPGGGAPVERSRVLHMLQALLEDRFHLRWHEQIRETSGYALRLAAGGAKLGPAKEGRPRLQMGNLSDPRMTLESLCQILEFDLGKPVADQTELHGTYAIELQWAREKLSAAEEPDTSRPSLFTAVREQLGLRLEPAKVPVKTFAIDEVERPSEN